MLTGLAFPPGEERDTLAALILVKHIRFSEESWRAANFPAPRLRRMPASNPAERFPVLYRFWLPYAPCSSNQGAKCWHSLFFLFLSSDPILPTCPGQHQPAATVAQGRSVAPWDHTTIPVPVPQAAAADPASTHLIMLSAPFVSGKWPCSWVIYKMPSCCCYTAHFHTFRCQGDLKCEQFSQHSPHGLQPGGYCLLWYAAALKHLIIWSITTLFSIPEIIQGGLHQSLTDFPSSPFTIQKTHLTTKETSYWIWNPGSRGGSPFLNHKDVLAQLLPFVTIDSSTLHRPKVGREVPAYSLHLIPTERPKGKQCSSPGKAVRWNLYAQSNSTWQTASLQGTFMYKERGW